LALALACGCASAQSLIQNPQQGASPIPLDVTAPRGLSPSPVPVAPVTEPAVSGGDPIRSVIRPVLFTGQAVPISDPGRTPLLPGGPGGLPAPTADPLAIDPASDPILQLARATTTEEAFHAAIGEAVKRNPALGESVANREEAEATRNEARSREYPVIDLSLSHFEVVSRAFSNDPGNILERQRPRERTDGIFRLQQPIFTFGATAKRIEAGNYRLQAASAGIEDTSSQIALRAISAWYGVYGYRALVRLGEAAVRDQIDLRDRLLGRVQQGMAARGDLAQMDSYIAAARTQLADFRRSLASVETQYTQLIGMPPPPVLARAPVPTVIIARDDDLAAEVERLPSVRAARLAARASAEEASAIRRETLPSLGGSIDAGRYGVIETAKDYDIRATATVSLRLLGGAAQRVDQATARAHGADARYERTLQEAERDARIAWSDVKALEDSKAAVEANYIASRTSRDVLVERFRISRGTLFDVLSAESNYFGVAARYVQTITDLDTARYALLARTGRLLDQLGIEIKTLDPR
jgi:outer membrane protein, adhesin transport system